MQAIVAKLQKLHRNNVTFRSYPKRLLDENPLARSALRFGRQAN
jgi:hypothetical protein